MKCFICCSNRLWGLEDVGGGVSLRGIDDQSEHNKLKMENDHSQTPGLLINWSKWLITINLFSATGCVIGLKTAEQPGGITGVLFFLAILCFAVSLLCSSFFVFLLSACGEQAPVIRKYTWLAQLQLGLFALGLLFVLGWIAILSRVVT